MHETPDSDDPFYILSTASRAGLSAPVLKDGDTFAVFNPQGDMISVGESEHGLYHDGTRFLSRLELRLSRRMPLLLSSGTPGHNELFGADLTNPDIVQGGHVLLPRNVLHIARSRFLLGGRCYDRIELVSYGDAELSFPLQFDFDADFADIFEVRGTRVERRGEAQAPSAEGSCVVFRYHGRDGVVRTTRLRWAQTPQALTGRSARFDITLAPRAPRQLDLVICCELSTPVTIAGLAPRPEAAPKRHDQARRDVLVRQREEQGFYCEIKTSNPELDVWLQRSLADVQMMCTEMSTGPYPYAGVPWYNTTFGRDGIITALELLWVNPDIARGVLSRLAALQATSVDIEADAEPGKILHEVRGGELAALGELPFRLYYGSVDTTPLFIVLAAAYYQRTADIALVRAIWPNIARALAWLDGEGDADGDGFVEYVRRSRAGLLHQGWKDSHDAIFHADGSSAEPPIALCEVQAYVYQARRGAAELALALGRPEEAAEQERRAEVLRERFERAFWCEELSSYGLALDADKRLCRVRASNAGHCLFAGIAAPERARRISAALMRPEFFSGWGVRTLATSEARYNPMSYHNGSVWPHDNAIIAAGMSRYGLTDLPFAVFRGLFEASRFMSLQRLPELFCGFDRRSGESPTLYPVACSPQSWAAGAPFMLLGACLGLTIDAPERRVTLRRAVLPELVDRIVVKNLRVAPERTIDLCFERHAHDVGVRMLRRAADVEVVVVK